MSAEVAEAIQPASRRDRLAVVADRVRPMVLAGEQTLPLAPALGGLLPDGALRRGITVTITGLGTASVAVGLVSHAVQRGSWVAFVDLAELNLGAVQEAGVSLERVACITTGHDTSQWATAVAALLGSFDLVVVGPPRRVRATDVRRLGARARERGSVLVALAPGGSLAWPEAPDLSLTVCGATWTGLGAGFGHLQHRHLTVRAEGRRGFSRPRQVDVVLPQPAASAGGSPFAETAATVESPTVEAAPIWPMVPVIARAG